MSQQHFQKFVKKKKNSVIKEELRQEKKKVTKERKAFFEKQRADKWEKASASQPTPAGTKTPMRGYGLQATGNKMEPATGIQPRQVSIQKPGVKSNEMPLNKFLAHCGVSSRREAVEIIKSGKVKVNNVVILEPSHKVTGTEDIKFNGKKIFVTKNLVYILLNKPKDYITTTEDPQGRKTVLELTKSATTERIYPIGRLDRNTSGVLLLTNDGELTQKLSHPSYQVKKIYEARLDKPLTKTDFDKISKGLNLEDGFIQPDALGYADPKDKKVIGIEIQWQEPHRTPHF